ncbi:(Fe-S)-binding protein [Ferroplasma sp.]|uniref:(Fe-S)-binding protein n=1 Tax=Ferroplasma sp. TaxID=2591003 RepID=UPI00307EECC7
MNLIKSITDITEKCISCGFCESVCPTLVPGDNNSVFGARGRVILADFAVKNNSDDLELADSFYSCLDCYACVNVCPAGVNAGVVSELMKEFIVSKEQDKKNPIAELIKTAIMEYENPLGLKKESASWASGIEFNESSTYILTGHMYQMMPYTREINKIRKYIDENIIKNMAIALKKHISLIKFAGHFYDKSLKEKMENDLRNIIFLLKKSGVKFGYLGSEEPYPGMFLYDLGYIEEFREYAKRVYGYMAEKRIKKIIAIDPHTYDLLKNIYPKYVSGYNIDVIYYTDLLDLKYNKFEQSITVQEPCHMLLHDNNFNAMNILNSVAEVKLPSRNGKFTMCCGGPDELLFPEIAKKASKQRYMDLKKSADNIVTICPLCYNNLAYDKNVHDFSEFVVKLAKK